MKRIENCNKILQETKLDCTEQIEKGYRRNEYYSNQDSQKNKLLKTKVQASFKRKMWTEEV